MALLNSGYDLWKPVLEDPQFRTQLLDDRKTEAAYRELEPDDAFYNGCWELYWTWMAVCIEAKDRLTPQNLRMFDVEIAGRQGDQGVPCNPPDPIVQQEEQLWQEFRQKGRKTSSPEREGSQQEVQPLQTTSTTAGSRYHMRERTHTSEGPVNRG